MAPPRPRLDYGRIAPGALRAMLGLERYLRDERFDRRLLHLIKLRASQINGCVHCIELHTREAVRDGEDPRRLFQLSAWEESPLFDARERAALRWTESLTRLDVDRVPDAVYRAIRRHFSPKELLDLTLAIVAINGWNRLAVGFRIPPAPR